VARQLAEAVVHHVRQLQVQAGQAVRVSIALEPPELGRVTMKLTFSRQGLEALFYTPDRAVKAVIEQALPHLREALARQEINVGNAGVFLGHEEAHDQAPRFFRGPWLSPGTPGEVAGEQPSGAKQSESRSNGVNYLV
jgi:flagellar hook-length control protein FliK